MEKKDRFDGYSVNVFLDDDNDYLAHFVEMPEVSAFGESPEQALHELETAWEGVKESLRKHGEPEIQTGRQDQFHRAPNVD